MDEIHFAPNAFIWLAQRLPGFGFQWKTRQTLREVFRTLSGSKPMGSHFLDRCTTNFFSLYFSGDWEFTGGTIWVLTHGPKKQREPMGVGFLSTPFEGPILIGSLWAGPHYGRRDRSSLPRRQGRRAGRGGAGEVRSLPPAKPRGRRLGVPFGWF